MPDQERIAIAWITRPKGVRGLVRAQSLTHSVERFDAVTDVIVQREGAPDLRLRLEYWHVEREELLLKFEGIDTPEESRSLLAGGYVTVAREELAELPPDTYYVFDLVGCTVQDRNGLNLGTVVEVLAMPSTDVYRVDGPKGEVLIPAVEDFIVAVCLQERRIIVQGIEALVAAT